MTLIDTNVLLDLATDDPTWFTWSFEQVKAASLRGHLLINDIIYAELSARYERIEDLDDFLHEAEITLMPIPREALFLAGKAFVRYRKAGGTKQSVLSDFFIGAHAAIERLPLLTRDVTRYRTYFPTVELLTPQS